MKWHPREIPELEGVPKERAEEVVDRAHWRASRDVRSWGTAVLLGIVYTACLLWLPRLLPDDFRRTAVYRYGCLPVAVGLLIHIGFRAMAAVQLPFLRRCVRAELGTHCPDCDYDLRATPDLPPPAQARCPECGKPIPRNVHRPTIPAAGTGREPLHSAPRAD